MEPLITFEEACGLPAGSQVECMDYVAGNGAHDWWYRVGDICIVGEDSCGDYGPKDRDGHVPSEDYAGWLFRVIEVAEVAE